MIAQKTNEDGNVIAARIALHNAIDDLAGPRTTWINNETVQAPPLLDQILDELAGQQGNQQGAHARSMPPLWVDAIDLVEEINIALTCWGRGLPDLPRPLHIVHTVTARVRQLGSRPYRPQDAKALEEITETLKAWAKKADELLNPKPKWSLPHSCPACGTAVVYRKDAAGENVRQPALAIGPEGCTCQHCHHTWGPQLFTHLARVLGMPLPAGVLE